MPTLTENEISLNEIVEDEATSNNERKGLIFNISPCDGARCKVMLEASCEAQSLDIPIGEEFEIIIGEAQNETEEQLENALDGLRKGNSTEIVIEMRNSNKIQDHSGNQSDVVISEGNDTMMKTEGHISGSGGSSEGVKTEGHISGSGGSSEGVKTEGHISGSGGSSEGVKFEDHGPSTVLEKTDKNNKSFINIKASLIDFQNPPNVCDYTHQQKLEIAKYHKTNGVELFKIGKRSFAYKRFSKALKLLLLMLPRKDILTELHEEFDLLRTQCYSNMAACLLKENQYELVIKNCSKSLEIDAKNIKSLYRRAEAHFYLHRYRECKQDVEMGLKLEPNSRVFRQLSRNLIGK